MFGLFFTDYQLETQETRKKMFDEFIKYGIKDSLKILLMFGAFIIHIRLYNTRFYFHGVILLLGLIIIILRMEFSKKDVNQTDDSQKTEEEFQSIIIDPIITVLKKEEFEKLCSPGGIEWLSNQVSNEKEKITHTKSLLNMFIELFLIPSLVGTGCIYITTKTDVIVIMHNIIIYIFLCILLFTVVSIIRLWREYYLKYRLKQLNQLKSGLEYIRLVWWDK